MFYKRLEKALKYDFKDVKSVVDYCKKEAEKNYSDSKCHDLQCICEYLIYIIENEKVSFEKYQIIQYKETFGRC